MIIARWQLVRVKPDQPDQIILAGVTRVLGDGAHNAWERADPLFHPVEIPEPPFKAFRVTRISLDVDAIPLEPGP